MAASEIPLPFLEVPILRIQGSHWPPPFFYRNPAPILMKRDLGGPLRFIFREAKNPKHKSQTLHPNPQTPDPKPGSLLKARESTDSTGDEGDKPTGS